MMSLTGVFAPAVWPRTTSDAGVVPLRPDTQLRLTKIPILFFPYTSNGPSSVQKIPFVERRRSPARMARMTMDNDAENGVVG